MRVFVTGGSGFVGRNLIAARESGAEPVSGDLTAIDALTAGMGGCDAVSHDAKARRELGYEGRMTHEQGFAEMRG